MIRVPPEGPLDAKIAFIGEAPGAKEEKEGRPFVGKAGGLFDNLLKISGISRPSCYITNTFKVRPPRNDIDHYLNRKSNKGEPKWENVTPEGKAQIVDLLEELEGVRANVFVLTGNIPLWALTRHWGILKWRGSLMNVTLPSGRVIKVLPTIHPAALIERGDKKKEGGGNYLWRYPIRYDLHRAVEQSKFPELRLPQRTYITGPTAQESIDYIEAMRELDTVGFDIEVDRNTHELLCFSLAPSKDEAMCVPLAVNAFTKDLDHYFTEAEELEVMLALARFCEDDSVTKLIQNVSFEFLMLNWLYGIRINNFRDTMVEHGVLYPDLPKSLAFQVSIWTEEPYYKDHGRNVLELG